MPDSLPAGLETVRLSPGTSARYAGTSGVLGAYPSVGTARSPSLEGVAVFHLIFFVLLYFLPSIIARDKKDAAGIFLVNFFLGWTVIGWVAALLWACASDHPAHLQYAPAS